MRVLSQITGAIVGMVTGATLGIVAYPYGAIKNTAVERDGITISSIFATLAIIPLIPLAPIPGFLYGLASGAKIGSQGISKVADIPGALFIYRTSEEAEAIQRKIDTAVKELDNSIKSSQLSKDELEKKKEELEQFKHQILIEKGRFFVDQGVSFHKYQLELVLQKVNKQLENISISASTVNQSSHAKMQSALLPNRMKSVQSKSPAPEVEKVRLAVQNVNSEPSAPPATKNEWIQANSSNPELAEVPVDWNLHLAMNGINYPQAGSNLYPMFIHGEFVNPPLPGEKSYMDFTEAEINAIAAKHEYSRKLEEQTKMAAKQAPSPTPSPVTRQNLTMFQPKPPSVSKPATRETKVEATTKKQWLMNKLKTLFVPTAPIGVDKQKVMAIACK